MAGVAEALIERATDPDLKPELAGLYRMHPSVLYERYMDFVSRNGLTNEGALIGWMRRLPNRGEEDPDMETHKILHYFDTYIKWEIIDGLDAMVRRLTQIEVRSE